MDVLAHAGYRCHPLRPDARETSHRYREPYPMASTPTTSVKTLRVGVPLSPRIIPLLLDSYGTSDAGQLSVCLERLTRGARGGRRRRTAIVRGRCSRLRGPGRTSTQSAVKTSGARLGSSGRRDIPPNLGVSGRRPPVDVAHGRRQARSLQFFMVSGGLDYLSWR
jgi:hypothetical protein